MCPWLPAGAGRLGCARALYKSAPARAWTAPPAIPLTRRLHNLHHHHHPAAASRLRTKLTQKTQQAHWSSSTAAMGITDWVKSDSKTGEFKRQTSSFRNQVSADGPFKPESGRYHLYVSLACPWAHRTLIVRKLKGLDRHIPVTIVHWQLGEAGWRFATADERDDSGMAPPPQAHLSAGPLTHLMQLYKQSDPDYAARATVPVLFDTRDNVIVNNESAEIVRIFGRQFDSILEPEFAQIDITPEDVLADIDGANEWIYKSVNNGVYRAGFATTQDAYDRAVKELFESLDRVEARLAGLEAKHKPGAPGPFFFGDRLTETDIRLFPTIVRFDPVYVQHFKCNIRDIRTGYPAIHRWLRRLYWHGAALDGVPADSCRSVFADTTDFEHIKLHYTRSHRQINPLGITPAGPIPNIEKL